MLKCCYRSLVAEAEAMLQKTLLKWCCRKRSSKKTSAFVASKCTSTFLFICLFFTLVFLLKCSRWRQTCLVCRRLLHQRNDDEPSGSPSYANLRKKQRDDDELGRLAVIYCTSAPKKKQRNDDEPSDSPSYANLRKKQRDDDEPGRLAVICCTSAPKKKQRNDDEPSNSPSSANLRKKQRDDDEPGRLAVICCTWRKKRQRNDDEPRRLAVIYYT